MRIFIASTNTGKIERYQKLLCRIDPTYEIVTPFDECLEHIDVEETGETLAQNALLKAKTYVGKVDMPIIANDTGFWVRGEGLVIAPQKKSTPNNIGHA